MKVRLSILVLLVVALVLPATAASATPTDKPFKGTLITTIGGQPAGCPNGVLLTIVSQATPVSTASGMGRVTLVQHQCVQPTSLQPDGTPAAGTIQVLDATLTAANGDILRFTTGVVPFTTFTPPYPATPLPIEFSGTMTFSGGTGRFAHASGTAEFQGRYCFMLNGGMFTFTGSLTW